MKKERRWLTVLREIGIVLVVFGFAGFIVRNDVVERVDNRLRPLVSVVEGLGERMTALEIVSDGYTIYQEIERRVAEFGERYLTLEQIKRCATLVYRYHQRYGTHGETPLGMDYDLILAWILVESRFNPEAVSSAGALGLTQQMPNTFKDGLIRYLGLSGLTREELRKKAFDPETNLFTGLERLAEYQKAFMEDGHASVADWKLALSLYNWSVEAVRNLISAKSGDTYKASLKYAISVEQARKDLRSGG